MSLLASQSDALVDYQGRKTKFTKPASNKDFPRCLDRPASNPPLFVQLKLDCQLRTQQCTTANDICEDNTKLFFFTSTPENRDDGVGVVFAGPTRTAVSRVGLLTSCPATGKGRLSGNDSWCPRGCSGKPTGCSSRWVGHHRLHPVGCSCAYQQTSSSSRVAACIHLRGCHRSCCRAQPALFPQGK